MNQFTKLRPANSLVNFMFQNSKRTFLKISTPAALTKLHNTAHFKIDKSLTSVQVKRDFSLNQTLQSNIFNIQDESDFQTRVLNNQKPVIVDFHAIWCGPCKILGPRLEKIMATYQGKADFAKVDIDQLSDLAFKYNINSVPTVIAIKNGQPVSKFVGLLDDDRIKKFVTDVVEK